MASADFCKNLNQEINQDILQVELFFIFVYFYHNTVADEICLNYLQLFEIFVLFSNSLFGNYVSLLLIISIDTSKVTPVFFVPDFIFLNCELHNFTFKLL